jgi:hypothetical protein
MIVKITLLFFLLLQSISYADIHRDKLASAISSAIKSRNLDLIESCYSWYNVNDINRDLELFYWIDIFSENTLDGAKISEVKWIPLNQIEQPEIKSAVTKKRSIRGRLYNFNLMVLGVFKINYENGRFGNYLFAGLDNNGEWKLASTQVTIIK